MSIRVDPQSRQGSFLLSLAAFLLRGIVRSLAATWRLEIVAGREIVADLLENPRPVILSFWHNRSLLALRYVDRELIRRGVDLTLLASQSRDGELVVRFARGWRMRVVRGSSTRGGREALRLLYRAIVQHRSSPVMTPDGPKGPLYQFKLGVAVLAQMTQAPLLPLGLAANRFWRLRSWDRLIVPKPFARLALVVGALQEVPRELGGEALEAERQRLEAVHDKLTLEAEKAVSAIDTTREPASEQQIQ